MDSNIVNGIDLSKHEGLVRTIAKKHAPKWGRHADEDDIKQIARLGLIWAAQHFDPSRGYQFSTYAMRCMFGFIQNECENLPLTPVPAQKRLTARGETFPSMSRSSDSVPGPDMESFDFVSAFAATTDTTLEDVFASDERERIKRAVGNLNEKERFIIRARFGLNCGGEETLVSIAARYKVSRARVQQIEQRALRRLAYILSRRPRPVRRPTPKSDMPTHVVRRPIHSGFDRSTRHDTQRRCLEERCVQRFATGAA